MRRPPPIAGLFALLAAGLTVIALAAWGGGAKVPAFAAAVLALWMGGLCLSSIRRRKKPTADDSSIQ